MSQANYVSGFDKVITEKHIDISKIKDKYEAKPFFFLMIPFQLLNFI